MKLAKITFKGVASDSFDNIKINYEELPFIPEKRSIKEYVIGKDGAYIFDDGFNNIKVSIIFMVHNNNSQLRRRQLSNMAAWLQGNGELVLALESDVYYDATVLDQMITNVNHFEDRYVVQFDCKPIKKSTYDNDDVVWADAEFEWQLGVSAWAGGNTQYTSVTPGDVLNPINFGTYKTNPIIEITGTATTVTLTDDDGNSFTYTGLAAETIYIDCEELIVYSLSGSTKVNEISNFNGNFLTLLTGENTIDISGTGFSSLDLKFNYRNAFL